MAIHGNKSQTARTKALADFKKGELQVLVATDIAARGIDIDQLPHVVNFEMPNVPEDYVHRIGRTGRAGSHGRGDLAGLRRRERLPARHRAPDQARDPEGDRARLRAAGARAARADRARPDGDRRRRRPRRHAPPCERSRRTSRRFAAVASRGGTAAKAAAAPAAVRRVASSTASRPAAHIARDERRRTAHRPATAAGPAAAAAGPASAKALGTEAAAAGPADATEALRTPGVDAPSPARWTARRSTVDGRRAALESRMARTAPPSRSALLAGATGLVGRATAGQLLAAARHASVTVLVRRAAPALGADPKLALRKSTSRSSPAPFPAVDDVFIALGTTIKVAGSRSGVSRGRFRLRGRRSRRPRERPARPGSRVVSALGADADSRVFYNRVKGESEAADRRRSATTSVDRPAVAADRRPRGARPAGARREALAMRLLAAGDGTRAAGRAPDRRRRRRRGDVDGDAGRPARHAHPRLRTDAGRDTGMTGRPRARRREATLLRF